MLKNIGKVNKYNKWDLAMDENENYWPKPNVLDFY